MGGQGHHNVACAECSRDKMMEIDIGDKPFLEVHAHLDLRK